MPEKTVRIEFLTNININETNLKIFIKFFKNITHGGVK